MSATKIRSNEWKIPTDENHNILVDSYLIKADWCRKHAFAGQKAPFLISTAFVGHGAVAKIKGQSEQGRDLGTIEAKVLNDQIQGSFDIPEDLPLSDQIYFTVTFEFNVIYPPNNPGGFSSTIKVFPMPKVPKLSWSKSRANRGEVVALNGTIENVPNRTPAKITIYRVVENGTYDKVTQINTRSEEEGILKNWQCGGELDPNVMITKQEAQRLNIVNKHPLYIFTVSVGDKEYGKTNEISGRLEVFFKPRFTFSI